ncbi:uncharacterized protein OCT59_023048 [Rhizophagus irregularis]|uniref:uncharacterized protein n=1 Tax=Rhizophagus irregularis TaxID=588596 RepID=UPI003317A6E4|nr:hypothetical protein OCT59_023048 [Rhizophagus irregularis]
MMKEQEKYKKRFTNSLKSHKNKWNYTNNEFESKLVVSKHRLKRRCDILKKHYISNKELEFLKKKEAAFEHEDIKVAEQSSSAGKNTVVDNIATNFQKLEIREQDNVLPWQEILRRETLITRPEFHRG